MSIDLARINSELGRNAEGLVDWAIGLGQPTIVGGPEGRFRFWDLRGYQEQAGLSDAAVRDAARALVGPLLARLPARSG